MGPYSNGAGGRYRLTAILMHTGTSAHSGHYTARIMEQPPVGRDEEGAGDGTAAASASAATGGATADGAAAGADAAPVLVSVARVTVEKCTAALDAATSYEYEIRDGGVTAETIYGAIHGLETLAQLVAAGELTRGTVVQDGPVHSLTPRSLRYKHVLWHS